MLEQRNLILAIVLSVTIIIAFQYFYELPRVRDAQRQAQRTEQTQPAPSEQARPGAVTPAPPRRPRVRGRATPEVARSQALAQDRAGRHQERFVSQGSLALTGGRLDNLTLTPYRQTDRAGLAGCAPAQPAGRAETPISRSSAGCRPTGRRGARPRHRWHADSDDAALRTSR